MWNCFAPTFVGFHMASNFTGPVWQKPFKLLLKVYEVTKAYPKEEKYSLVSNTRRATNSVTNNISEGFGRYEKLDKTRFYKISRGSCYQDITMPRTAFRVSHV
ncbi:hypothetical protein ES705_27076 [subsurface metagenome]